MNGRIFGDAFQLDSRDGAEVGHASSIAIDTAHFSSVRNFAADVRVSALAWGYFAKWDDGAISADIRTMQLSEAAAHTNRGSWAIGEMQLREPGMTILSWIGLK